MTQLGVQYQQRLIKELNATVSTESILERFFDMFKGGFTADIKLEKVEIPKYFSSQEGFEQLRQFEHVSLKDFTRFCFEYLSIIKMLNKDNAYFGCWLHGTMVYFDISYAFDTLEEALEFGKTNNQLAIWDNINKQTISCE